MDFDINEVKKFVGNITSDQMLDVDTFLSESVALFFPSTGPCQYAVTKDHTHPAYSFILIFNNNCQMVIDGRQITAKPGIISVFSPEVKHHEEIKDDFPRYIAVFILREYFEKQFCDYSDNTVPVYKGDYFHSTNELKQYIKDFILEYKNAYPGYKKLLKAIGLNIAHTLIRILLKYKSGKQEMGARIEINNIIEYMHKNYNKKISIAELSYYASLSASHFSRTFRQETGKSPLDYLIRIRLEKAKKLLLSSAKNMTEIAYDTGFNSSSHFTTSFSKHYNMTPSHYKTIFKKQII